MRRARYGVVEDDGAFYGDIPAIPGVWANAKTLEACREELESALVGMGAGQHCRSLPDSRH
jgi:predicted RNase H-like HicB family nuclease